jgi:PPOX class probable F420-dependent enzyme
MREMSEGERRAFLLEGTRTGKLGVTRIDGSPYVLPVWFLLDGDDVIFTTGAETVRGRALRRDGRVSMLVDEERPPYGFVRVDGHAVIDEDLDELRRWARALGARYMGEDVADRFAERNAVPGELLVRIVPDRIAAQADVAGW